MKIIHLVLGKANPERMNGVNKVVHSLASNLFSIGADVEVWGITPTPTIDAIPKIYPIRLFQSHKNKLILDTKLSAEILKMPKNTLFHLHGGFIPEFYKIANLLIQKKLHYIITPHGNYTQGALEKNKIMKNVYFSLFEKKIIENAASVHCIGKGEIADLNRLTTSFKSMLIPNGQDLFPYQSYKKADNTTSGIIFGFCGRIIKYQKGLDILIEAFKKYKIESHGNGVLWIIGDGEYLEEIKSFIAVNSLQDSIVLFGSKFNEEKIKLMSTIDCFLHPSRNEGLPMAVLEAAMLGKPLIVSEFTNMTDYVKKYNAGICLKENTVYELSEAMKTISKLKTASQLDALGKNSRKMAEENFDWKRIAYSLNAFYETIQYS